MDFATNCKKLILRTAIEPTIYAKSRGETEHPLQTVASTPFIHWL